jgi:MFS transporter, FSR family, fosmidomycin resistance protein
VPAVAPALTAVPWLQDARTIGVVGVAHATSHFFHLLLPPLFPAFIQEFGLSYSQLGLLMSVFFVVSGLGQALAGFLVDRVGARPVLHAALACFVAAALVVASAQGYASLAVAAVLLGLGNAPFHPADFTILNKRVSPARLGHAFSAHGISGNLGWAAAPVFLIGLSSLGGSWRVAYVGAALLAAGVWLLVLLQRDALEDREPTAFPLAAPACETAGQPPAGQGATARTASDAPDIHALDFLKLPILWMCFGFFFVVTAALAAIQTFSGPALQALYGLPLTVSATVVTGFTLLGALGMVLGGFLSAKVARLELTIGVAMSLSALLMMVVATGAVSGAVAVALCILAGLGSGLAGPSRDMLIRRATPPGASGRVYGTVYSGLDAGFAVAAPLFGWLLDRGQPAGVFMGAAVAWILGVAAAAMVSRRLALHPS